MKERLAKIDLDSRPFKEDKRDLANEFSYKKISPQKGYGALSIQSDHSNRSRSRSSRYKQDGYESIESYTLTCEKLLNKAKLQDELHSQNIFPSVKSSDKQTKETVLHDIFKPATEYQRPLDKEKSELKECEDVMIKEEEEEKEKADDDQDEQVLLTPEKQNNESLNVYDIFTLQTPYKDETNTFGKQQEKRIDKQDLRSTI